MKKVFNIIKTTICGGILFLLPLVLVIMIIEKAFKLSKLIIPSRIENVAVAGIPFHNILGILVLLLVCFIAGFLGRTSLAKKFVSAIENNILIYIPGYEFMKGMGEELAGIENNEHWKPVMVMFDDNWQMGFLTETAHDDIRTVFIPDAPKPWSGVLVFVPNKRILPLNITQKEAVSHIRGLGNGLQKVIKESMKPDK